MISLNLEKRKAETVEAEEKSEARKEERIARFAKIREDEKDLFTIYKLTQDNVLEEGLTLRDDITDEELSGFRGEDKEEDPEAKALMYPHRFDPYERETVRILQDLIAISKTGNPVNISEAKAGSSTAATPQ